MKRLAMLAAVCAALAGAACIDGEGAYVQSTGAHFTPGVTTRADAVKALGPPSSVFTAANGEQTLAWARDGGLFNPGETRQYSILFGSDGRMIRVLTQP